MKFIYYPFTNFLGHPSAWIRVKRIPNQSPILDSKIAHLKTKQQSQVIVALKNYLVFRYPLLQNDHIKILRNSDSISCNAASKTKPKINSAQFEPSNSQAIASHLESDQEWKPVSWKRAFTLKQNSLVELFLRLSNLTLYSDLSLLTYLSTLMPSLLSIFYGLSSESQNHYYQNPHGLM